MADDPDMHKELIEDFDDATVAIVDITPAKDVVNKVFDSSVLGTNNEGIKFLPFPYEFISKNAII